MSTPRNEAATAAANQYETLARQGYGMGIPALQARNAALMPALRQAQAGDLPDYMQAAFATQRTGLQEGIAGQERLAIGRQDAGAKGVVAGGNLSSVMNPAQMGQVLADAMTGSRVQQGMATINQTNSLMNMGLGGAGQAGNSAIGAAGNNLNAISMLPNYNQTYAGVLGAATLAGVGYDVWKQGNQTGIPNFNQNSPIFDMRPRG